MLKSKLLQSLKKLISIVVLFSFLLTSCSSKGGGGEDPKPNPLRFNQDLRVAEKLKKVGISHAQDGVEQGKVGEQEAGERLQFELIFPNAKYNNKDKTLEYTNSAGIQIKVGEVMVGGRRYTGEGLLCVSKNESKECPLIEVRCIQQAGSEECALFGVQTTTDEKRARDICLGDDKNDEEAKTEYKSAKGSKEDKCKAVKDGAEQRRKDVATSRKNGILTSYSSDTEASKDYDKKLKDNPNATDGELEKAVKDGEKRRKKQRQAAQEKTTFMKVYGNNTDIDEMERRYDEYYGEAVAARLDPVEAAKAAKKAIDIEVKKKETDAEFPDVYTNQCKKVWTAIRHRESRVFRESLKKLHELIMDKARMEETYSNRKMWVRKKPSNIKKVEEFLEEKKKAIYIDCDHDRIDRIQDESKVMALLQRHAEEALNLVKQK